MSTLHHDLKHVPCEFYQRQRWNILTVLIAHANINMRCWPTIARLGRITGYSHPVVGEAIAWLTEHKAIELVPFEDRIGEERSFPIRQFIYQLTGKVVFGNLVYQYLYVPPVDDEETTQDRQPITGLKVNNLDHHQTLHKVYPEENTSITNVQHANAVAPVAPKTQPLESKKKVTAPAKPRERDPLFDSVALHHFGVTDTSKSPEIAGRVGKLKKIIIDGYKLRANASDVTPEALALLAKKHAAFVTWYKNVKYPRGTNNVDIPRDAEKFAPFWIEYREWYGTQHTEVVRKDGDEWSDDKGNPMIMRNGKVYARYEGYEWTEVVPQ